MAIYSSEKHVKEFRSKLNDISQKVLCRHIVPLFQFTEKEEYASLGSGVFINVEGEYFLFTAAHVVQEHRKSGLFIPSTSGIIPLHGLVVFETKIHKDIAFIVIDKPIAELMKHTFDCLDQRKLIIDHRLVDAHHYVTTGFPEKGIKKEGVYMNYKSSFCLLRPSRERVYSYYKKDTSTYLIFDLGKAMNFDSKKISEIVPYGMSGGGIWYIGFNMVNDSMKIFYELIGIITEFRKGKYHIFIGTKIKEFTDIVDHYFDNKD